MRSPRTQILLLNLSIDPSGFLLAGEELMDIVIWNPMFRGENEVVSNVQRDMTQPNPPTSPTAGMVHIDQDIGAYEAAGFLAMIRNSRLMENDEDKFPKLIELVNKGYRFSKPQAAQPF